MLGKRANHSFDNLDNPQKPDRDYFFSLLGSSHWLESELEDGDYWDRVKMFAKLDHKSLLEKVKQQKALEVPKRRNKYNMKKSVRMKIMIKNPGIKLLRNYNLKLIMIMITIIIMIIIMIIMIMIMIMKMKGAVNWFYFCNLFTT